jgi:chemotaxis protein CheX
MTVEATTMRLADVLDLTASGPLHKLLLAARGQDVTLDASAVRRIGGLCAQVLLSARATWVQDGFAFRIADPTPELCDGLALLGCADLADANPVQDRPQ